MAGFRPVELFACAGGVAVEEAEDGVGEGGKGGGGGGAGAGREGGED